MATRSMRVRRQISFLTAAVMRALVVAMAIMISKKRGISMIITIPMILFPKRRLVLPQEVLVGVQEVLVGVQEVLVGVQEVIENPHHQHPGIEVKKKRENRRRRNHSKRGNV